VGGGTVSLVSEGDCAERRLAQSRRRGVMLMPDVLGSLELSQPNLDVTHPISPTQWDNQNTSGTRHYTGTTPVAASLRGQRMAKTGAERMLQFSRLVLIVLE
jgi:hypothetical protein